MRGEKKREIEKRENLFYSIIFYSGVCIMQIIIVGGGGREGMAAGGTNEK